MSEESTEQHDPDPETGASDVAADAPVASGAPTHDASSSEQPHRRHLVATTFAVAAAVVALDQLTKWLAVRYLEGKPPVQILGDWLALDFLRNPGAAFSFGTGFTFVFPVIAIAVVIVIVRTSRDLGSLAWAIALGGMLGGAVGNLIDRLFRDPGMLSGHVVDFIFVKHFAVFNVADAAITCSAVLMVVLALMGIDLKGTRAP
ncbi:MAG TPA: signal peptidase II [Candidatus Nanopelagicales bacterium]|nr:signal peptidase II [Candidatus Nanopelagicales bacterium]